jgi:hypothetical protein
MEKLDWLEKYVVGHLLVNLLDSAHEGEVPALAQLAYSIAEKTDCSEEMRELAKRFGYRDALKLTAPAESE